MTATIDLPDPPLAERAAQLLTETGAWIGDHSTRIVIAALLGAAIVAMLMLAKWLGRRIGARATDPNDWQGIFGRALAKTRLWFMVATAAQIVANYAHAPADLAKTINFVFVVAATLQAAVYARALILGAIEHRARGDADNVALASALNIIRVLVTVVLFALAAILILSNLGVNVNGLLAGLGIGGIAIGLAAQGIFKDLFAALSILFDRPFRVTDLIRFGDVTGRVEAIGLKSTRIRALDGEEVIMSNDKLLDQQIRNFHGIESRRIVLTLPLHYANDAAKLAALPLGIEQVVAGVPDSRFGHALLTSCDANAAMFEILLYSTRGEADVRDRVRHDVIAAALAHLAAQDICLSYQSVMPPHHSD